MFGLFCYLKPDTYIGYPPNKLLKFNTNMNLTSTVCLFYTDKGYNL